MLIFRRCEAKECFGPLDFSVKIEAPRLVALLFIEHEKSQARAITCNANFNNLTVTHVETNLNVNALVASAQRPGTRLRGFRLLLTDICISRFIRISWYEFASRYLGPLTLAALHLQELALGLLAIIDSRVSVAVHLRETLAFYV
ncbi:uncharacterized protein FOMMEDRAFT_164328 [Fomitiporia mediterranea MF3/22]|uniref:uncharacterized protein n=1 Tax=Fomitiporia mediterranea (strain MF3/22) TaxID=694068 RepID=UPI0004408742|nr:uncharacterized protein FOMMEDRAFT_164328 [Fomitiporia mediterranea MF3/22]EJD07331.1 hypothetical protein FOMMEDRAFT_164328 [Fomitiporia mediterranea MF3/22]